MNRLKLAGLIVITGILTWYYCPWFGDLVSPRADCGCETCVASCEHAVSTGFACDCDGNECGCPACVPVE